MSENPAKADTNAPEETCTTDAYGNTLPKIGDAVRFFAPRRKPVDATITNLWPGTQIEKYDASPILVDLDYHVIYDGWRCLRREFRVPPYEVVAKGYGWKLVDKSADDDQQE